MKINITPYSLQLAIILIILDIADVIDIPWWGWILSIFWIPLLASAFIILLIIVIYLVKKILL